MVDCTIELLPVLESAEAWDAREACEAMDACDTSDACDADVLGMLRPNAALGVKLGMRETEARGPQVLAFLLVTSPVATGACSNDISKKVQPLGEMLE